MSREVKHRKPGKVWRARAKAKGKQETTNASQPEDSRFSLYSGRNIIPRESVAGQALAVVIAIMAFLACLTVGAVSVIERTASLWQTDIVREVTVQIRPFDEDEMEAAIGQASRLLLQYEGIKRVRALDARSSAQLLEPWLGSGLDLTQLPVPRLLTVTVDPTEQPDFAQIRQDLQEKVPGAYLDDHRAWSGRLSMMAWTTVAAGLAILGLVLVATVLTVVFATRGAMAGNRDIVDVLHFVGAEGRFIAREFERHFLALAMRGAIAGGVAAALVFAAVAIWSAASFASPQADQLNAMFGSLTIGWRGFVGIVVIIGAIALLCAMTSRLTVMMQIGGLERSARRRRK